MINKNQHTFLKKKLPLCIKMASSLSLAMGVAAHTYAADAKAVDAAEEIVVTGQRASIDSAQEIKKNAEVVVDSITAVDIGALPDRSVAEALQRIPGVSLQRTNENRDPARLASEGGGVFVRGLSWINTLLNGHDVFSASNGRSLGFEDVSADLMAGVDVYKSPSADLIEGGIGGTVDLRTRLPFDSKTRIFAVSADYNYADLLKKGFTSGNALYSDRFETDAGEFGVLVSISQGNIGNRTDSLQTARFESYTKDGVTKYLPDVLGQRRIDWEQTRNSYTGALQWAPNDELTLTASVIHTDVNPKDVERAVQIGGTGGSNLTTATDDPKSSTNGVYNYNSAGVLTSGTVTDATIGLDTRYGNRTSATNDYSIGFKYAPDTHWTFKGDIQFLESMSDVISMTAYTSLQEADGSFAGSGVDANFNITGNKPSLSVTGADRQVLQNQYYWAAAMDHIEDNNAHEWAGRLDADYAFDNDSLLKSFRFGARSTNRNALTRQSGWNWGLLSAQPWGNGWMNKITADKVAADQTELYTFDNFFRGDIKAGAVGWFPKQSLLTSNAKAYQQLKGAVSNGWGWAPLTPDTYNNVTSYGDNVSAGINDQTEKTNAIYSELRFGDDEGTVFGKPFDGNLGVRLVKTETSAVGRSTAGGISDQCATSTSADCVGAKAFVDDFNTQLGSYKSFENSYTNVLPSFNIRFKLQDDLQLRLGVSETMVRPSFSVTRPYHTLSFTFQDDLFNPNKPNTVTSGAPELKPTISKNIDSSLEWYFAPGSSMTLALFYKDISDYIMGVTDVTQLTYGGQTYAFEDTHQINGSKGTLKGIELGYQQFFDMLPGALSGLGIQANFTYIDNQGGANPVVNINDTNQLGNAAKKMPLEGMSRTNYNLALMYEKYGVSARLAYNWRERYLLTTSAANANRPVWMNDYGQLDASVFYNVTDSVKVGMQATNLSNSRTTMDIGYPDQVSPYSWTDTDRRVAFVVRAQF